MVAGIFPVVLTEKFEWRSWAEGGVDVAKPSRSQVTYTTLTLDLPIPSTNSILSMTSFVLVFMTGDLIFNIRFFVLEN